MKDCPYSGYSGPLQALHLPLIAPKLRKQIAILFGKKQGERAQIKRCYQITDFFSRTEKKKYVGELVKLVNHLKRCKSKTRS